MEILFRGKRKDTGEWVYGCVLKGVNTYIVTKEQMEYAVISMKNHASLECHQVIEETVGQYTGLTDKNGKKIFDGDIIAGCNGSINGQPWIFKSYDIKWIADKAQFNIPLWGIKETYDSTHWFEVIGTIHDEVNHDA